MKILDTTAGSTHAIDNAVKLYLPPAEAATVLAYLDQVPNPAKARQDRTGKLEALIGNAVESIRAKLEQQHQTFRISAVLDHLWIKRDLYAITKPPTRAVVQRVLVKHGLYVIAC